MSAVGQQVTAVINGVTVTRYVPNRVLLADFLRADLGLTGTKVSCELQVCGVCSVLVDGRPISSCSYLAVDIDGCTVETVEGLAREGKLHPLQQSFVDNFALQCGFCTPGFLMLSKNLLDKNRHPTRDEVVHQLEGNICRCTGYRPIVEAVLQASEPPADWPTDNMQAADENAEERAAADAGLVELPVLAEPGSSGNAPARKGRS